MLAAKGMIRTGEKINRVGQDFQMFLHFLTNSEIQNFYQIKPKFNCDYSKNILPKKRIGHT